MRGDDLMVEAHVQVAFVSGGRAKPIPKPLRIAMKADQESGGGPDRGARAAGHDRIRASHLFETAIGACGMAGARAALHRRATCPKQSDDATQARACSGGFPAAQEAVAAAEVHSLPSTAWWRCCAANAAILSMIVIDDDGHARLQSPRSIAIARQIPPGETMTYGEIAERLGDKCWRARSGRPWGRTRCRSSCRAIACWRPSGKTGGFSAQGGVVTKLTLADHRRRAAGRADSVRRICRWRHRAAPCLNGLAIDAAVNSCKAPSHEAIAHEIDHGRFRWCAKRAAVRAAITTATSKKPWCAPRWR